MKKLIFLLFFSTSLFADAIDDAVTVLNGLSGKTLTNPQMLSIVNRYNTANGFSNPWDETDNPVEFAAWPTNLERATFFLQHLRGEIRSDLESVAAEEYDATAAAAKAAAKAAAADEL
jgi:hypothetical protein